MNPTVNVTIVRLTNFVTCVGTTHFVNNCTQGQSSAEGQPLPITIVIKFSVSFIQYQLLYYPVQYCLSLEQLSSLALSGAVLLSR